MCRKRLRDALRHKDRRSLCMGMACGVFTADRAVRVAAMGKSLPCDEGQSQIGLIGVARITEECSRQRQRLGALAGVAEGKRDLLLLQGHGRQRG